MSIIFTKHARMRMRERKISRKEIEDCILRPSGIHMETERIQRFRKKFAYGIIEAVVELRGNHFIVITIYSL